MRSCVRCDDSFEKLDTGIDAHLCASINNGNFDPRWVMSLPSDPTTFIAPLIIGDYSVPGLSRVVSVNEPSGIGDAGDYLFKLTNVDLSNYSTSTTKLIAKFAHDNGVKEVKMNGVLQTLPSNYVDVDTSFSIDVVIS